MSPDAPDPRDLRKFFENGLEMLCIADMEGRFRHLNPAWEHTLGWTQEELTSRPFLDYVHPEDVPATLAEMAKLGAGSATIRFENRYRCKDGSWRWLEWKTAPADERGLLFAAARDVTDRRRIAAELDVAHRHLEAVLESAGDAIFTADGRGRIESFNPAAERMFGHAAEEVIGRPLRLLLPEVRPAWFGPGRQASGREVQAVRRDGRPITLDLSASRVRVRSRRILIGIARDITEQKERERALAQKTLELEAVAWQNETETQVLALFSSTHDRDEILPGVLGLLAARHSFTVSALYLYDEWSGRLTCAARHAAPADLPLSIALGEGLLGEAARDLRPRIVRGEETPFPIQAGIATVRPAAVAVFPIAYQGKMQGVLALACTKPLTEQKEGFLGRLAAQLGVALNNLQQYQELRLLSEQLQRRGEEIGRKNQELERADRLKSEFLANMSHELRTPLNSILGFSDILRDGIMGDLTAEQREQVDHIHDSGQHLLALINDILDLSKIEAGQMDLSLEPVVVGDLVKSALSVVKERAHRHGVKLEASIAPELTEVRGDPRKLKQILFNLLSNAVKFTAEGGRVWLEAGLGPAPGSFFLRVGDTGIGISKEDLPRLFQPFQQLDSRLSRRFEGTGLGLVMVRRLAELHGGSVEVDSEPGRGSVFTVRLPHREDMPASGRPPEAAPAAATPSAGSGRLILVVEDEERDWALLQRLLETAGYRALHARNGQEGLEMLRDHRPDLVVLDLIMPDMDGFSFLEEKVRRPHLGEIPVLVVTQFMEQVGRASFAIQGALSKPIGREQFLETVRSLVPPTAERSPRILLVDDDPRASRLVSAHLSGSPYALMSAFSGTQGLDFAARYLPDLIVLDLMMPDISGLEVAEELRRREATRRIPILILTGKTLSEAERARLLGIAQAVAEKSGLREAELLEHIRRMLPEREGATA